MEFFNWSVHWPDYLAGWINRTEPLSSGQDFMYVVGAIKIVAGILALTPGPAVAGRRPGPRVGRPAEAPLVR